jgi:hypothetical protein
MTQPDPTAVLCSRYGQLREPHLTQPLPDGDAPLCRECCEQLDGATCLATESEQ